MKIHLAIIYFFLLATQPLFAGNTLILEGGSVEASETITIHVKINNDDAFVAFQSDIVLPDVLEYIENSAVLNTQRAEDHQLSARLTGNDTLRLFGYSTSNSPFSGNSGAVASFQLKAGTVPGDYSPSLSEALIGDAASNNILTSQQTNPVTLLAPDITLSKDSLDFGEIPLQENRSRQITIQNAGNQPLEVTDINISNPYYSVDEKTFSIQAEAQQLLTVQYDATEEEDVVSTISINSNDPDEASREIKSRVYAFAVNELHTGTFTAFSGDQATLSFSINNMESFTGFQFDMMLPDVLKYVAGSARLSQRSKGHTTSANQVSENELRVVSYSQSNEAFEGSSGEVVYLDFQVNGTGGSYSLNLNDVIIGDSTGKNIVSDYYNNSVTIASPDIHGSSKLNFGEVAITDQPVQEYGLENTGEDTLIITEAYVTTGKIKLQDTLPLEIAPHASQPLPLLFEPDSEGPFSETLRLRNNDPDEDPWTVTIEGNVFMPNYMSVQHAVARKKDTIELRVEVDNYEPFVGFQFDLTFPDFATCLTDQVALTSRADNHDLQISMVDANTVRAFAYSMDMNTFSGKEGAIITIPLSIDASENGNFNLSLSNALLGNENSEDILYQARDGQLTVANFEIDQVTNNHVQCYGTTTGEISIQAEGEASSLSYSIDNGATWHENSLFTDLGSGNYNVKVKNNGNGLILTYSDNPVLLEQPEELVIDSLSLKDVTGCHGNTNGSIAIAGSGGSGELEYSIDDGLTWHTDSLFTGLSGGEYQIMLRDQNGCMQVYQDNPVVINEPTPANISISASPSTTVCGGEEIQLDATHPAAESYYWDPSGKTSPAITVDSSGIGYGTQHVKVTVVDTNQCTITEEIDIEFTNCTGIHNPDKPKLLIYPNPASEEFTVEMKGYTGETQIALYNALGKLVQKNDPVHTQGYLKNRLLVNGLANGLYYVRVKCGKNMYVRKVFIH